MLVEKDALFRTRPITDRYFDVKKSLLEPIFQNAWTELSFIVDTKLPSEKAGVQFCNCEDDLRRGK